jgi:predicted SnoaL-like aldol condensation-catalyzing enzyme
MKANREIPVIEVEKYIQEHWTEEEKQNVRVVIDFFQKLMNEHDFEQILNSHKNLNYIQHNRAIPTQISGLVEYVKDMCKRYPEYSFDVKKVYADKDMVILHSHTTMKAKHRGNEKKGFIITDSFRLKDGKLAEHWDAIQPIDTFSRILFLLIGGQIKNNNSTF